MREIKFKVWNKKEERWMDYQVMLPSGRVGPVTTNGDVLPNPDKDVEVCFWTGLKDKNGKEIYEGDILKGIYEEDEGGGWHIDRKVIGKVYFDPYWGVKFDCKDATQRTAETHWDISPTSRDCRGVEIIGNIYENPELLVN